MVYAGTSYSCNLWSLRLIPYTFHVLVATEGLALQAVPADAHPVPSGRCPAPIPVRLIPHARFAVSTIYPFTGFC